MELLASCSSPIGEGIGGFWDFTELYRICWKTKGTAVEGMCLHGFYSFDPKGKDVDLWVNTT